MFLSKNSFHQWKQKTKEQNTILSTKEMFLPIILCSGNLQSGNKMAVHQQSFSSWYNKLFLPCCFHQINILPKHFCYSAKQNTKTITHISDWKSATKGMDLWKTVSRRSVLGPETWILLKSFHISDVQVAGIWTVLHSGNWKDYQVPDSSSWRRNQRQKTKANARFQHGNENFIKLEWKSRRAASFASRKCYELHRGTWQ